MKNYGLWCLISITVFFFFACKKHDATEPQPPAPSAPADTLSAGWTKTRVADNFMVDIFFRDSNEGYLVSSTKLYKTLNGGSTWDSVYGFTFNDKNLFVTDSGNVFVVTSNKLFASFNGAQTLEVVPGVTGAYLSDVHFTDNDSGYVGSDENLFYTYNGGKSWDKLPIPGRSGSEYFYTPVFFSSSRLGWMVNIFGFYEVDVQAKKVNHRFFSDSSTKRATAVQTLNERVMFFGNIAGSLYKSTNGGMQFTLLRRFDSGFMDIQFFSEQVGYISAGNKIYKTVNGGQTWTVLVAIGADRIIEIHFLDEHHGWACGTNGLVLKFEG